MNSPHPPDSHSTVPTDHALVSSRYEPSLDAHIWRNHRTSSGQLRCGLLLNSRGIEAWALRILEMLQVDPILILGPAWLVDSPAPKSAALLSWLYRRVSPPDSLLTRAKIALPPEISVRRSANSELLSEIRAANLDVLFWLDSTMLRLDCAGLARLGVWYFQCGDPGVAPSGPPYWREVAERRPVSALALIQDTGEPELHQLALCHLPTQPGLHLSRNADDPLGLAPAVLIRKLLDVLDAQAPAAATAVPRPPASPPVSNLKVAAFMARQTLTTMRARSHSDPLRWFVAIRKRGHPAPGPDRLNPQGFEEIHPSNGSQLADPFLFAAEDRQWLFVEEIPKGAAKAHLSVLPLDPHGAAGEPVPILTKPYHLSYPAVFRHGSDYFMLPETAGNNTVELYRATRFPFEWKLERVLFSGVRALDSTPLFLDGIWYLWTTSARLGQETFLFWSNALDGEWHYHPRNPICSDARRARGAGALFRSGDALIRPAQDCAVRYGHAIALNRVLEISPHGYAEELTQVIRPTWRKDLLGTHTLASNDAFEAIDGLVR